MRKVMVVLAFCAATLLFFSCSAKKSPSGTVKGLTVDAAKVAKQRGLKPEDIYAALKTYEPSGKKDEAIMFASGGHSGQLFVIGLPSMRLLKTVAVFTPEPWQGYGYGGTGNHILAATDTSKTKLRWGDTHHPALSETNGNYDGEFLFINDKANARVAVVDLHDFETKQILKSPNALNDHGGTFVTPNTEYVLEGPQYPTPIGWSYAPKGNYKERYRGILTFWAFDRVKGRIIPSRSFAMELPPYWQDICDAGKKVSDGWVFCNSFNTELATGGVEDGNPPFEAGASKNDTDYLHIIDWKKAETLFRAGKTETINGMAMIRLQTAIKERVLFFTPEPKSPHGADVTPGGEYIVVSGKLDPHVTVYSFAKIKEAISSGNFKRDAYGVPVIPIDESKETEVEVGLGPLHTQFDPNGYAYTSLFLDSAVARWTLGGPYAKKHPEPVWKLIQKIPIQYNVGHVAVVEGDTASPVGKYLVSLNKWSIDRFLTVGPLLPQNLQLIDIDNTGTAMKLLYDMPLGVGEPHYAQIIMAKKMKAYEVYPKVGWDPEKMRVDPKAATSEKEARIVRKGNRVEIWSTLVRSHFKPEWIEVKKGDHVVWHLTNIERAKDATHGFALSGYNINLSLEPGETQTIAFEANISGTYSFYCTEFCSALHLEMAGYFLVQP